MLSIDYLVLKLGILEFFHRLGLLFIMIECCLLVFFGKKPVFWRRFHEIENLVSLQYLELIKGPPIEHSAIHFKHKSKHS